MEGTEGLDVQFQGYERHGSLVFRSEFYPFVNCMCFIGLKLWP